jgi:GH43 family beta-xylosidase
MRGKVADQEDRWAIDASVFENRGARYLIWSGWPESGSVQGIYIARLRNPLTIRGHAEMISTPTFSWEATVNEGPEILKRDGKIFLIYSANGCWTDNYALGMLTTSASANVLNARSWVKSPTPVFTGSAEAHAYGPGHNGFFVSPDGLQSWIIYHANPDPGEGCKNFRSPRAQPFTWNANGTPNFGSPVPIDTPLPKPSGSISTQ